MFGSAVPSFPKGFPHVASQLQFCASFSLRLALLAVSLSETPFFPAESLHSRVRSLSPSVSAIFSLFFRSPPQRFFFPRSVRRLTYSSLSFSRLHFSYSCSLLPCPLSAPPFSTGWRVRGGRERGNFAKVLALSPLIAPVPHARTNEPVSQTESLRWRQLLLGLTGSEDPRWSRTYRFSPQHFLPPSFQLVFVFAFAFLSVEGEGERENLSSGKEGFRGPSAVSYHSDPFAVQLCLQRGGCVGRLIRRLFPIGPRVA